MQSLFHLRAITAAASERFSCTCFLFELGSWNDRSPSSDCQGWKEAGFCTHPDHKPALVYWCPKTCFNCKFECFLTYVFSKYLLLFIYLVIHSFLHSFLLLLCCIWLVCLFVCLLFFFFLFKMKTIVLGYFKNLSCNKCLDRKQMC